ncbi:class I SAM-dependent methyltransferase [Parasphingopyxis lamellibrachiae]|uniref:Methyltransferase family protein n=1 Tax=Parasphingopyxis lamellibrachiae TaxID=680125 RepID=A0A3D9FEF2_9SPHN|nr:class I SAM-dependent methyltransferase [Parasphingopyxis lamellibrachiae]RED16038.1 methyltransferase family protein [Parasphingopyxis lamellibrachiae]
MPTDYEQLYRESRKALGEPTRAFEDFFDHYPKPRALVLDIGCGQGRDALFIARLGHHVTGIDQSPSGIADMLGDAAAENLDIEGEVADVRVYRPAGTYDVIVIDRTLHMLRAEDRIAVLQTLLRHIGDNGCILIADENRNMPAFKIVFEADERGWAVIVEKSGTLFLQCQ